MENRSTMNYNFSILEKRIIDTLSLSDLHSIREKLMNLKGNTITVGSGGSKVVSDFASQVLSSINGTICTSLEPRDFLHTNTDAYDNVVICSNSGRNHGVEVCSRSKLNRFLLTGGFAEYEGVKSLPYISSISPEKSFISLGSTMVPMSILLGVYNLADSKDVIRHFFEDLNKIDLDYDPQGKEQYDIFSGIDTKTPETFIESTLVESGMGDPVIHHKYDFCHGRSTRLKQRDSNLIYLISNPNELDRTITQQLRNKNRVVSLEGKYGDPVWNSYFLTLQSMYLMKSIAEHNKKDLSQIDYDKSMVRKLYGYKGDM